MHGQQEPRRASALGLATLASVVLAAALLMGEVPARAGAEVTVGGPFTLTTPDRTTVTDATFRGKWLLVFFSYTSCPDTCPTTLSQIAGALDQLGSKAAKVQPIFITIDPERDTPEVMRQYIKAFDSNIIGLTGSPQQIAAVSLEYGVYSARQLSEDEAEGYRIDHSTYIYIMNQDGKFVRGLDFDMPSIDIANILHGDMARFGERES